MADLIQVKRGDTKGESLADGEFGYSRDGKILYIGDNGEVIELCRGVKMANIAALPSGSGTSAIITAFNSLISALIAKGLMEEGE